MSSEKSEADHVPDDDGAKAVAIRLHILTREIVDVPKLVYGIPAFFQYLRDYRRYKRLSGDKGMTFRDAYPVLHDKRASHPFDAHYLYQNRWAFERILKAKPKEHVDVASEVSFVSLLSCAVPVRFVDLRMLDVRMNNLTISKGDITKLPFPDNSIESLSCLHVVEHVGLGRYGDEFDPRGTEKACRELARVLAPKGNLYVGLPIGRDRVCYNAHRIHSSATVLSYFPGLDLVEFSGIDDKGSYHQKTAPNALDGCDYGCGLFWFTKQVH